MGFWTIIFGVYGGSESAQPITARPAEDLLRATAESSATEPTPLRVERDERYL